MPLTRLSNAPAAMRFLPGLGVAAAVAIVSVVAEGLIARSGVKIPAIILALALGMALHRPTRAKSFEPGLTWSIKKLLRIAIALLGLRIALSDIIGLGPFTAFLVVASMAVTLVSGVVVARWFGRSDSYGALAGGATAVCGASAALAVSTVLPPSKEREADTVFVVLAVNALSTVAMVLYPLLASALGFDERMTGVLLGATIHDVAQVVGAGYSVSDNAGNLAVVVKLFRVFLLLPVVLAIGWHFSKRGGGASGAKVPAPVFAFVFLGMALLNSVGIVPTPIKTALLEFSRWGLLIAIAALGVNTSLKAMADLGWRHLAVVSVVTLILLAVVAAPLAAFGL